MNAGRNVWRGAAALLVVLLVALTYPGALIVSMIVRLTPAPAISSPAPQGVLPWLHVEHRPGGVPYIADDQRRLVLLHGAIPGGLIDFWYGGNPSRPDPPAYYPIDRHSYDDGFCPANTAYMPVPPLCQEDIAKMASLGFNSVRLPLSWSLLEPERGRFSEIYLDRIAQVVGWARAQSMYVILDMHQNAYSRYVGAPADGTANLRYYTGAPAWATITDGFHSQAYLGQREVNPAVLEANTNFWYDRGGIQDEYIAAVANLAERFNGDPAVAGYSLFNEPWPGWNVPPGFEDLLLFPFYRRVIDAITGVGDGLPCWSGFFMPAVCGYRDLGVHDRRHLLFLDTGLLREVTDFPTHLGLPVSSYPNLVLSLHVYTHVYTFDALAKEKPDHANYPWGGFEQSYSLAEREGKAIGAALFVAEFGNSPEWDSLLLANQLLEQERHLVGFAFWTWMENCGGSGSWGIFSGIDCGNHSPQHSSGCLRQTREGLLSRVYPRASADPHTTYHYNAATGAFSLQARGRTGDAPTIVYLPRVVNGDVTTSGAATMSVAAGADGSRLVSASPSGGDFSIAVSASPVALSGCV